MQLQRNTREEVMARAESGEECVEEMKTLSNTLGLVRTPKMVLINYLKGDAFTKFSPGRSQHASNKLHNPAFSEASNSNKDAFDVVHGQSVIPNVPPPLFFTYCFPHVAVPSPAYVCLFCDFHA